jgi:hypothetical protein
LNVRQERLTLSAIGGHAWRQVLRNLLFDQIEVGVLLRSRRDVVAQRIEVIEFNRTQKPGFKECTSVSTPTGKDSAPILTLKSRM